MEESNKNQKHFTLIVVPHTEGEARNYRIPLWLCQVACFGVIIFFITLFTLLYYYRDLRETAEENVFLREEIEAQKNELEEVTEETERLGFESDEIEEQIEKVSDILDIEPPEVDLEVNTP